MMARTHVTALLTEGPTPTATPPSTAAEKSQKHIGSFPCRSNCNSSSCTSSINWSHSQPVTFADMRLPLICHWNSDGDIANGWFAYYSALGVNEFHIILHGPVEENRDFVSASSKFPVTIHDSYQSPFDEKEKIRRLNALLPRFLGSWILVVDSDECVELPLRQIATLVNRLEFFGQTYLYAPLVQRIRLDGSLESPRSIGDLFSEFPLCDPYLAERVGYTATRRKYPLVQVLPETRIFDGNHEPPNTTPDFRAYVGVSHHFKWKASLLDRLNLTIDLNLPWSAGSAVAIARIKQMGNVLPTEDAFLYSRDQMFKRGLLVKPSIRRTIRRFFRLTVSDRSALIRLVANALLPRAASGWKLARR
jgi:hypothetical protein